jgi:hypothetical protein
VGGEGERSQCLGRVALPRDRRRRRFSNSWPTPLRAFGDWEELRLRVPGKRLGGSVVCKYVGRKLQLNEWSRSERSIDQPMRSGGFYKP